jgi:hypothetical protein
MIDCRTTIFWSLVRVDTQRLPAYSCNAGPSLALIAAGARRILFLHAGWMGGPPTVVKMPMQILGLAVDS